MYFCSVSLCPPSLDRLIREFSGLPGIGRKSARRLAYHMLSLEPDQVQDLASALVEAKERIHPCSICFQFTESDPCPVCASPRRDRTRICVVEKPVDLEAFEASGAYKGLYHVLGGTLSPLDGVGPKELRIPQLIARIREGVDEVILALGSSPEADSTVLLIDRMLGDFPVQRTRLARGIPVGSDLEFIDEITMLRAFEGRVHL